MATLIKFLYISLAVIVLPCIFLGCEKKSSATEWHQLDMNQMANGDGTFSTRFLKPPKTGTNSSKPDLARLKNDIVGQKIKEQPDGYRPKEWHYWIGSLSVIKDLQILSTRENDSSIVMGIQIRLQDSGQGEYLARAEVTYILQNNEWRFSFLESKEISIVETGRYNSCITHIKEGWSGEFSFVFTNRCSVEIEIGGVVLPEFGNTGWRKFALRVPPNGTARLGGLAWWSVQDFRIHYIEQP
ncbi:MAG: hypothetical protein FWG02_08475 [Holophagaceae bacterium]|nr:hypothetical protein [Holophagaceae bacterium]